MRRRGHALQPLGALAQPAGPATPNVKPDLRPEVRAHVLPPPAGSLYLARRLLTTMTIAIGQQFHESVVGRPCVQRADLVQLR
jgi:hypothetical protein